MDNTVPYQKHHFEQAIPVPPKQNKCSCPYSSSMLTDTWAALIHLLATDPDQGILTMPEEIEKMQYWQGQVQQQCDLPAEFASTFHLTPDERTPGERVNKMLENKASELFDKHPLDLSESEATKVIEKVASNNALGLSMMLADWETALSRCTTRSPEDDYLTEDEEETKPGSNN